jgi:predicted dehydrogenase
MDKVRWGIIGCGDVTEIKSGPALQKVEGSELIAVMRRDGAKAADYAKRHGVPRWYDDADRLIADPDVNAVYVATPPSTHADYCLRAAAAGKPVYVEKPMACTVEECQSMIDGCRAAGVKLFVAYYRRCQPRFLKVKELLAEGAIGAVRAVSIFHCRPATAGELSGADWRADPAISGGGLLVDLASHTLDLLDHLLGSIDSATGAAVNLGGRYNAEDTVAGHFRFNCGAVGAGTWCFTAGVARDAVEILGERGAIHFATFADEPITVQTAAGTQSFAIAHPPHVQQPLIQTVVDDLLGRGNCPSTGETALRTTRIVNALRAGWRGNA